MGLLAEIRGQYTYSNPAADYWESEILPPLIPRDLRIFTHSEFQGQYIYLMAIA